MKEEVKRKIDLLNDTNILEVSKFIDFLNYRPKNSDLIDAENLLDYFKPYKLYTWHNVGQAVRSSGIDKGPMGGYMNRNAVRVWMRHAFNMPEDKAEEALNLLVTMNFLHESSMSNNIC